MKLSFPKLILLVHMTVTTVSLGMPAGYDDIRGIESREPKLELYDTGLVERQKGDVAGSVLDLIDTIVSGIQADKDVRIFFLLLNPSRCY
jgi:hypothetical protein